MATLTSYLWRGVELNDGINYMVPSAGLGLDNLNTVEQTFAYRTDNTPIPTGITTREGTETLVINIRGTSRANYFAKLDALRTIFDTRDPTLYKLERRRSGEATYNYVYAKPTDFVHSPNDGMVTVTLQIPDRGWSNDTVHTQTQLLFDAGSEETMTINYTGNLPVEPTITIKAKTIGNDGPTPLYYRDVVIYTPASQRIMNWPILVVAGWDTTAAIGAGKMRSDGLDIGVQLLDGTQFQRIVAGTSSSRKIWIKPHTWPYIPELIISGTGGAFVPAIAASGTTSFYIFTGDTTYQLPSSGTILVDNEFISYSGAIQSGTGRWLVNVAARGVNSTTPAAHETFTRILLPTTVRITYGYAAGWERVYSNDQSAWPAMDYDTSTNSTWYQTSTYTPGSRPLRWTAQADAVRPKRNGEYFYALQESNAPLVEGDFAYAGYYLSNPYPLRVDRLFLNNPPNTQRVISNIKLTFELKSTGSKPFSIELLKCNANFNWPSSELAVPLWSTTHSGASTATVDTGYIATGFWTNAMPIFFRIQNPPVQMANQTILVLKSVEMQMDREYGQYPREGTLGSEGGIGTGEFPVYLSEVLNLNDPLNTTNFSVYTRMAVDQTMIVDCASRLVTGANLQEVSYKNPIWLRLVKGTNAIRFRAPTGIGQVEVTLSWKNRY